MNIRTATASDLSRIAEIYVFNNRINYLPIFKDVEYSFKKLQVISISNDYFGKEDVRKKIYVYDDGIIKGFVQVDKTEIIKLYVDTFFQKEGIGSMLIRYVIDKHHVDNLWVLEKNVKAITFYNRHGFFFEGEMKFEEGTSEKLLRFIRKHS
ncbi:GNAT family N-acetyltransferase [Amedibacterium intestinale]|jgi:acetyltransferase, GNAT family|uniref:GNAT family N-acetyltransferase n=1 Tax=Amedibacterium intestinale TaxID=2583452 RepID=UPI000E206C07